MKKTIKTLLSITFFVMLMLLGTNLKAQDAKEIVRKSQDKMRGKTLQAEMLMTIKRPKWTREVSLKNWAKGDDYSLILITGPAKEKGQSFLKIKREMWNWQPSISRVVKLPPSMMSQSWMGSDFTNDDLIKQNSLEEDYTHKIIGSSTLKVNGVAYPCYKIEFTPKEGAPVVWGKIIMRISKEDYFQIKSEMFDEEGNLVNTMLSSQIKEMGGRKIPTKIQMIPADKPEQRTIIEYKNLVFDKAIDDSFFSQQNMKKVQ